AQRRGAIDQLVPVARLAEADLVIIAVPPAAVVETATQAATVMREGAILTDVASTKQHIVAELDTGLPGGVRYVGGHPMAGSAGHGPASADAALLSGRPYLLTPTSRTDPDALQTMRGLVERLGMHPVLLTPADHDTLVAQVSHMPYLVAVAAINAASADALPLHGPAFADVARVAASPTDLWVDICRTNRTAIKRALDGFRRELDRLERALDEDVSLKNALESSRRKAEELS
ncbi:MAG TPA: prephenate dehydrogenase/arogenate dehydrogenase family protein, partial [bacterium]